jgi:hypothetical protein
MQLRSIVMLVPVAAALAGCSSSTTPAGTPTLAASPDRAALTIRYEETAQFEIGLPSGRHVYLDVTDDYVLDRPPTADDILLATVMAPSHYDVTFTSAFPGRMLIAEPGEIALDDVHIRTIDASGTQQPVDHRYPGSEVAIIDAAGLRIVACGDMDQAQLDDEQLAAIGPRVDVALCPLTPSGLPGPNLTDPLALDVIDQMHPRLVIPTHTSIDRSALAVARWDGVYSTEAAISVSPAHLPDRMTICFMGAQAANFGTILHLAEATAW